MKPVPAMTSGYGYGPKGLWEILRNFDMLLFALVLLVTLFGILVIYGATWSVEGLSHYAWKQVVWTLVSLPVLLLLCLVDFRRFRQAAWPFYIVTLAALILLMLVGSRIKGARSWFSVGPIRIQPAEFAKLSVIMTLAHYLALKERAMTHIRDLIVPTLIAAVPAFLILIQPDLGTATLFFPMLLIMLYAGGTRRSLIVLLVLVAILAAFGTYPFLKPYQKARIKVFLNPEHDQHWQGYNIKQAEIGLGSGGLLGKGWKQGTQARLRFLPERHTDFIFSSLGEQFGFAGALVLLGLYGSIILRSARPALLANNTFGRLLVVGLLSCFCLHILFNIGMTIRLMPVTGLPLPLFSYGGSFLLTNFMIFAMILNIDMRKYQF